MFIQKLKPVLKDSQLNITLSMKDGIITAIILPKGKDGKDHGIKPITASGSAEELDNNLADSLIKPLTDISSSFSIHGANEAVETAKKLEEKPEKKAPAKSVIMLTKADAKKAFEQGKKLFDAAKYKDALPFYDKAVELDKANKSYAAAQKTCKQWVDRISEADIFAQPEEPVVEEKVEEVIETTPQVEQIEEVEPEEEDQDDFGI